MNKTNHIILTFVLYFFLFSFLSLINVFNNIDSVLAITTYKCDIASKEGKCVEKTYFEPCQDEICGWYSCSKCIGGECNSGMQSTPCKTDCSACTEQKIYKCKRCVGGLCKLKEFNAFCTPTCDYASQCQATDPGIKKYSCKICNIQKQCILKQSDEYCTDECDGPEHCSGTTNGTPPPPIEEEPPPPKPKDKWCCNNSTGACYKCSTTGAWSTQAKCEACCPTGTYLHCRPPLTTFWGADANKLYCKLATWCETDPGDECSPPNSVCPASAPPTTYNWKECVSGRCVPKSSQNQPIGVITCRDDGDCQAGTISCPGDSNCYRCNSSYQCVRSSTGRYTSYSKCKRGCKKPSTVSPPPVSPPPVSPPPVSPPPAPKCQIFEFSINGKTNEDRDPLYVWVDAPLKGYISVNDSCTTCTVTSDDVWGNPPKDYTITSLTTYINETFKIPTSETYSFVLSCIGDPEDPDDFDEDTVSLQTVEAINLPWWREIIPVLPGFLRGTWR